MPDQPERRGERGAPAGPAAPSAGVVPGGPSTEPGDVAGAALGRFGTDRLGTGPLDTDRLLTVDHRPRPPEVRIQAGLRADAGRLLANWVVRIANLPVYRARPDLKLNQLMDGLPAVVHAVLHAAATPDPALDPDPAARAAEAAIEHARRRAANGFPIGAILAEFRELHAELLAQLWRVADEAAQAAGVEAQASPPADAGWVPRATIERLAATIGDLCVAAAEAIEAAPGGRDAAPAPKGERP